MRMPIRRPWAVALSVVAVGAGYEGVVAAGVLDVGPLPGAEPPGRQAVFAAAELALVAASAGTATTRTARRRGVEMRLLPLAAGAFMLARFFSFDAYYAPTRRRMSNGGLVPPSWVYALVGSCAVASLLLWRRPRAGSALAAPLLFIVAATALAAGAGH
jgi:hypothetical protein